MMKMEAVVDRFEEDKAVLLIDNESTNLVLPRKCLPCETAEGDYLTITVAIDEEKSRLAEEEAKKLFQELTGDNTK